MSGMRVGDAGSDAGAAAALLRARMARPRSAGAGDVGGGAGAAKTREGAASGGADADAELRNACEQLESVFLEQLLQEMRRTVPQDDLFGGGRGEDLFQSMFDQEIAEEMAGRGGIGLAEILYRQLSRQAAPPSRLGGHRPGDLNGGNELSEG